MEKLTPEEIRVLRKNLRLADYATSSTDLAKIIFGERKVNTGNNK